jgi:ATP-dependent DNA helicase 2 subunit 2
MFLIDVSASMTKTREVEMPDVSGGTRTVEMTNLEWSLQFVKLKIQEMVCVGYRTHFLADRQAGRYTMDGRLTNVV